MKCKVCGQNCGRYVVCFEHRETRYKDTCKIHGKTTFINRQCLKCKSLKTPVYLIKDKKDRFGSGITKKHFLYPYLSRLTRLTMSYQKKFMQRISNTSGIYGIFYKNTCLYVGQSVNISKRIQQHKENFKIAKQHINNIKKTKKRVSISKIEHKIEYKYYEMANEYDLKELTFKTLMVVPKLKNKYAYSELLTYAEQTMMEVYKPKFNHIAARPTKK